MNYLVAGADLLSAECITAALVLQAIQQASPDNGFGFTVFSDTAPDVLANPKLARFLWFETVADVPTGNSYYYNGTSWTLFNLFSGANLANNSVPLDKLSLLGASALDIIQVNAGLTGFQYISVLNAIQNGSITLAKLANAGAGNFLVVSIGSVNGFLPFAGIGAYIPDSNIPITRLIGGGPSARGLWLRTFETGTPVEWAVFDPNEQFGPEELDIQLLKGSSLPVAAGQAFRRNAGGNGWEAYTPVTIPPVKLYAGIYDRRAAGTPPEAITLSAMTTKELNTSLNSDGLIISLAANQFVLAAGTYDISVSQQLGQVYLSLYLVNITTPGILIQGINTLSRNNTAGIAVLSGRFTVAAGQTLELQYYATDEGGGSDVLGFPRVPSTADDEIYTVIDIRQA